MSEVGKGTDEGPSVDTEAPPCVGDSNPPKRRRRIPKKCLKCGKSVQNLSRHQEEVHGMSKLKRKLHVYLSGEKKPPKGRVKFCPLSPCKRQRTPIFQLHKHLQSNVHKLEVGSPSYVRALDQAPRIALKDLGSRIDEGRKRRKNWLEEDSSKTQDLVKDERSDKTTSPESDVTLVTQEQKGVRILRKSFRDCDQNERRKTKKIEKTQDEYDSDEECKALVRRFHEKKKRKFKRVHKLLDVGNNTQEQEEIIREKHQEEKRVSDEEYDDLAERVWNNNKQQSKSAHPFNETGSRGQTSQEENTDGDKNYESDLQIEEDATIMNIMDNKANIVIEVSDSDESDTEYDPNEDSDTESSEACSTETSSCNLEECEQLMTGLVEFIGKDNCESGSHLDREEPWKEVVNKFIEEKEKEGLTFKTPTESENDLRRAFEERDQCSQEEIFQEIFQGDASDNDDALDQEWVPSDCETHVQTSCEKEPENKKDESAGDGLLLEFYTWLVGVDGGYRNAKVANQYKSQVQSVNQRLTLTETVTSNNQEERPAVHVLLIPGKDGDAVLKTWVAYAVNRYQPGTVRSYLMSLKLFYKFLIQEHKNVANATMETLNARRDLVSSWSAAQKKKVAKRKHEKRDEDFKKLLSSKNLFQICHGNQHINAIKQLASSSEQTSGGKDVSKVLSDKAHCEVRDWLITRLLIDNSGRSGVAANMKVSEFQEAVYYPGTEEDPARYRMLVNDHKTADTCGAAVVWVYDDLYKLIEMYVRTIRSQITASAPQVEEVFLSSNGVSLTSSQVSTCLSRTFQREGIETKGKISATIVRKSLPTGVHVYMPEEKEHLAALALHKSQTQASYYRVQDKVTETDLGRRAVKKLLSLKTGNIHHAKEEKSAPWTEEKVNDLRDLFKEEIATGAINESEIKEKVSTSNLLKAHSLKPITLKLRRMSDEYRKDISPPSEMETSSERVMRFLSSAVCESDLSGPVNAPSVISEDSRFWRKFSEEQTSHLLSVTKDLVNNNVIKMELVWQKVKDDARSKELGLVKETEDEEELRKWKQRLTDKVRQETRRANQRKKKKK